jgi:hypothetical protein
MGLLGKIGKVFVSVVNLLSGAMPLISALAPASAKTEVSELQAAVKIISTAEGMYAALTGGAAGGGDKKLQMAAPFIGQLLLEAEPFLGKEIADQTKFEAGVRSITSGLADVLSSLKA